MNFFYVTNLPPGGVLGTPSMSEGGYFNMCSLRKYVCSLAIQFEWGGLWVKGNGVVGSGGGWCVVTCDVACQMVYVKCCM